jgi:predicted DsbA family dithiol-disulfide isomerase
VRIAGEAGMDKARVMSKLAAGYDEDKVKEQIQQSAVRGVSSVPFFIIRPSEHVAVKRLTLRVASFPNKTRFRESWPPEYEEYQSLSLSQR